MEVRTHFLMNDLHKILEVARFPDVLEFAD
jgi:hypothetical protein